MKYIKTFDESANEGIISKTVSGILLGGALMSSPLTSKSQTTDPIEYQTYGYFNKEKELRSAIFKSDFSKLINGSVTFSINNKEKIVNASEINRLIKKYMPKDANIRKSSETNNGYTQIYGAYKGYDALVYLTLTFNMDGELTDVTVDKN